MTVNYRLLSQSQIFTDKMAAIAEAEALLFSKGSFTSPLAPSVMGYADQGDGAVNRKLYDRLRDETIFAPDYGVVPDASGGVPTDNLGFFNKAIDRGVALGKPLYLPAAKDSYGTSQTLDFYTGVKGDHKRTSLISAPMSSAAYFNQMMDANQRRPIVRLGWKFTENGNQAIIPFEGIGVRGPITRPPPRTSNPVGLGWYGNGIMYDESTAFIHAYDIGVEGCYNGIVHANNAGHIYSTDVLASNNWNNIFHEYGSGDIRYSFSTLTGAFFASVGGHSTNKIGGLNTGGFVGLTFIGVHLGFSPYVFYQPSDGNGSIGLLGLTMWNSSAEQVGNSFYKGGRPTNGQTRVSSNIILDTSAMIWTDPTNDLASFNAYTIVGDSNYPEREPMGLNLVQGGPINIRNGSLARGRIGGLYGINGPHTIIDNVLAFVRDDSDAGGIKVTTQGKERVMGMRTSASVIAPVAGFTATAGQSFSIGVFDLPGDCDNCGVIKYEARFNITGAVAGKALVTAFANGQPTLDNSGNPLTPFTVSLQSGDQDPILSFILPNVADRSIAGVRRIELKVAPPSGVAATWNATTAMVTTLNTGIVN